MIKHFIFFLITISLFAVSCTKGDSSQPFAKLLFADTSETKPYLDSTNFGVYKGVLAGGKGHLKMYFQNGDTIVNAYLNIDSLSDTLTCLQHFTLGDRINYAIFTGRISSFIFSADTSGQVAKLENIFISGQGNLIGQVAHESTTNRVYCYEGVYSGDEQGNFNFIQYGNKVAAVAKSYTGETYKGVSIFSGNIFSINMPGSISATGTFEGGIDNVNKDHFSGTWVKSLSSSGILSGVRTQ